MFLALACCLLSGCSLEWFAPDVSKAVSEKQQLEESAKQTALLERQAKALERIAIALEKP
jgi:hypothetical protein